MVRGHWAKRGPRTDSDELLGLDGMPTLHSDGSGGETLAISEVGIRRSGEDPASLESIQPVGI